ncbi:MAG TPA: GPW/gp25 family protein [Thermoanaerobaculia bacterium]|nr:GPW/gp25 family protein [Thermoanaerobaculia bacterium]
MQLDFPYRVDARGRSGEVAEEAHVRDLIEQLLFTNPGERVNRPDFGSGLLQLVFAPNSTELAAALQFSVQAALQQYLGNRIDTDDVAIEAEDSTLRVTVRYRLRGDAQPRTASFEREI